MAEEISEAKNKGFLIGITVGYHFIEGFEKDDREFLEGLVEALNTYKDKYKENPMAARIAARGVMKANGAEMKGF